MNVLIRTKSDSIIVNRPIFDTLLVSSHYTMKDKVPVKYVCTTSLTERGLMVDVFYRETPHPEFGNKYFGLYWAEVGNEMQVMITNADKVEELSIDMIQDSEDHYHYSRHVHDYHTVGVGTGNGGEIGAISIDGGRDYTKVVGTTNVTTFKIKDGEFYCEV